MRAIARVLACLACAGLVLACLAYAGHRLSLKPSMAQSSVQATVPKVLRAFIPAISFAPRPRTAARQVRTPVMKSSDQQQSQIDSLAETILAKNWNRSPLKEFPVTETSVWQASKVDILNKIKAGEDVIKKFGSGDKPAVVILPGFGNAATDYSNPFGAGFEASISYALMKRGFATTVMPLKRTEWANILRGIITPSFWQGTATPYEPSYGWYIKRARETIAAVAKDSGVIVIGHSAGGWLGRAVLGDGSDFAADVDIRAFVTLGAPQSPPPKGVAGLMDMTRGALTWTDAQLPGAFLSDRGIPYLTVASDLITGDGNAAGGSQGKTSGECYRIVCGRDDVAGDGVVPLQSAHLQGATQITLQCYHSIRPPGDEDSDVRKTWYGSNEQVDGWVGALLDALQAPVAP